jgi:hypothetical protein
MEPLTIAMIVTSVCCNLICFLFGVIYGRNSAYKTVSPCKRAKKCSKPMGIAATEVNLSSVPDSVADF